MKILFGALLWSFLFNFAIVSGIKVLMFWLNLEETQTIREILAIGSCISFLIGTFCMAAYFDLNIVNPFDPFKE